MIALGLVATASGAGLVLSLHAASRAQPAAAAASPGPQPGSAQARADLTRMQALLNTGSVSEQAALLAPPLKFAPGSGPVFPAGTTVTIRPGTFHADGQQFGTVQAGVSGGKAVTLALHSVQGHWRLFDIMTGPVQTRAKIIPAPGSQPGVRLMSATVNIPPTKDQIKARTPVILVHGWMPGSPKDWGSDSDTASMFFRIDMTHGTWVSAFDYKPTNTEWASNPSNGPALAAYIRAVAQASKDGGGNGKVIIVAHSMGGLLARYAASMTIGDHRVADDIGMVITLGTPNTGSFWSDAGESARSILCWEQTYNSQHVQLPSDFCQDWTALAGMSALGPKIGQLPELPSEIPLYSIAGNEIIHLRLGLSVVDIPLGGDGVVSLSSALHRRPGGGTNSRTTIQNPPRMLDFSAMHGALPRNRDIIATVHDLISAYIATHPAPAPALGGEAYWLAGGGHWQVHGMTLQISLGPSGLTGTETWNIYGQIVNGHARLTFTSNADGSLTGTYIMPTSAMCLRPTQTATCYSYVQGGPLDYPQVPTSDDPSNPQLGQTITLVPIAPMHAKQVYSSNSPAEFVGGNVNLCQVGLAAPAVLSCGA
jgi:pimeloyl-ACP methyl ester carboxylesterase